MSDNGSGVLHERALEHPVKTVLRILNDMLHDVSGGAWVGMAFALWLVRTGSLSILTSDEATAMQHTWSWVLTAMFAAFLVQGATGLFRIGHRRSPVPEALIKHAVFFVLFGLATWQAIVILQ